jgi:hypothetical protein
MSKQLQHNFSDILIADQDFAKEPLPPKGKSPPKKGPKHAKPIVHKRNENYDTSNFT